jgi:hypothetical protein
VGPAPRSRDADAPGSSCAGLAADRWAEHRRDGRLPAHRDRQGPDHHPGHRDHHRGRRAGGRSHRDAVHRDAGHRHHRDGDHQDHQDHQGAGHLGAARSRRHPDVHRERTGGPSRAEAGSDGRWPTSGVHPAEAGSVGHSARRGGPEHRVQRVQRAHQQGEAAEQWAHRDEHQLVVRADALRAAGRPDAGPWAAAGARRQVPGGWCHPASAGC